MNRYFLWTFGVLLLGCWGCAYYSTSASGSGGVHSIAIPLFKNESLEPEIQQALTDSLTQAFVDNGALKVVDEDRADLVLRGTVVEVKDEPFTYGNQASQYQVSVFVDMTCYDTRKKKPLWEEKRMRGYGVYSAAGQRDVARAQGLAAAVEMLASDAVDRTQVGGW